MALSEVAVPVQLGGGVETKTDSKSVPTTKLLILENGVFTKASSIVKRNGYEAFAAIDGAQRLATRGDELLAFTSNRCYSRQVEQGQWSDAGTAFSAVGSETPLVRTGTQQTQPDAASLAGVTVVAWEDSRGGVWWSAIDTASGRVLVAPTQADGTAISPRVVAVGSNLHVYYASPTARRVQVIVIDPANVTAIVSPSILVDDLSSTQPVYDVAPTTRTNTPAVITWKEEGTSDLRIGYVDQSGVLGTALTGHPAVYTYAAGLHASTPLAVASRSESSRLAVAYVSAANEARIIVFEDGPIGPYADNLIGSAVAMQRVALTFSLPPTGDPVLWSAWEELAAEPTERYCVLSEFDYEPGTVTAFVQRGVGLAGGAWAIGGDGFAVFVHDSTYFNVYLTLRLSDGFAVGRHAPGQATGAPARQHIPSAHVSGAVASVALPIRDRVLSESGGQFRETGVRMVALDFDSEDSHQTQQLGRGLYMAGACPLHYDGRAWTEQGFHVGPELIESTPATGGNLTSSTTYQYRFWYEWTDAQGEIHRGPVSAGTNVTMGASDTQVTFTLPMLRITQKQNARICGARSLAAKTGRTEQRYRITSLDPNTDGDANGYIANDPTVDSVTFIDRMSDATLALQEELYTDGGILSNDPAALGSLVSRGKSRLFFADASDPNTIRYSQVLEDGYGVECPPELTVRVDPFGGPVTALASQDDRIIVFKSSAIYLFSGDGPLPNGDTSTSGFSVPQLVTSDVGCTDPSSIVLTPVGHMFKSAKGIYLLNGGQVLYVGAAVEQYNSQSVRRATVLPDRTAVVFLTDSGLSLLFDFERQQWSTFTNHEGLDAAVVANAYHYLRSDGRVFREAIGSYSDAGTRIRLRLRTAWIRMQPHLQGFQRFWFAHFLGSWLSAHQLGVRYRTDYGGAWTDTYWHDATDAADPAGWITGGNAATVGVEPIGGSQYGDGEYGDGDYGGTSLGLYQWRLHLNEKGQSIQFDIEDFEASGYLGASFELNEILITGGVKGTAPRPFSTGRSL